MMTDELDELIVRHDPPPDPGVAIVIHWLRSGPRIGDGPGIYAMGHHLLGPFRSKASALQYLTACHRDATAEDFASGNKEPFDA